MVNLLGLVDPRRLAAAGKVSAARPTGTMAGRRDRLRVIAAMPPLKFPRLL